MTAYALVAVLTALIEPTTVPEAPIRGPEQAPAREAQRTGEGPAERPQGAREQDPITVTGDRRTGTQRRLDEDRRMVCQRTVQTGSVMPTRTCKTVAEWREIRERSIRELDRLRADRQSRRHTAESRGQSD